MADVSGAITLGDAIRFLGPLVGAGGLTAIVVAYIGSRKPRREDPPHHQDGVLLTDHGAIGRAAEELRRLTDAVEDIGRIIQRTSEVIERRNK